ncbi:hypothetical protein D9M73_65090 [compost metagenome]
MKNFDIVMLRGMCHSPVRNYVIPGLTSYLIGQPSETGTLRFFHNARDHQEAITPHSHRFDFQCLVLKGEVQNRVWTRLPIESMQRGDSYMVSELRYRNGIGKYRKTEQGHSRWAYADSHYGAGDWYSMSADQVHSINFGAGTEVLFFEGPTVSDWSVVLEPYVDGETIPTMKVEPWMFRKDRA